MTARGAKYGRLGVSFLRTSFWFAAIVLGAADAWATRFTMNADGISYLDISDAYWRGDWHMAINAYWSPFYSWILGLFLKLLKPSPYWEYPVVHLVNFLIYVGTLACFEFFLTEFIRKFGASGRVPGETGEVTLPEWAWRALGYSLFIWTSLVMTTLGVVSPDMCVSAFVYLACGLLLQIRGGMAGRKTFVLLGVILGFGYLAKAVMFPLAFVFLAVALYSLGSVRQGVGSVALSLLALIVLAAPFITAISRGKGRLTFGDSGRLNYAGCVNGVDILYPGDSGVMVCPGEVLGERVEEIESPSSRRLLHPVKRIFDMPATYKFEGPVTGTYPFWYDPSYWQEGIKPHFDLKGEVRAVILALNLYASICFHALRYVLLCLCVLLLLARNRLSCIKRAAANWPLVVPGMAGLGLYALVHVENRYIAPFVVLLWLAAFSGVRLWRSRLSKWVIAVVSAGSALAILVSAGSQVDERWTFSKLAGPVYWQAATALQGMGIRSGDKVAAVVKWPMGESVPFVARLVRARVDAQVNRPDQFFAAPPTVQAQVLQALAAGGVKAVVTQGKPPNGPPYVRWEELGPTYFYACLLIPHVRVPVDAQHAEKHRREQNLDAEEKRK